MAGMVSELERSWTALRQDVEAALAVRVGPESDCPPKLQEAMAYSLMAGGKRLRPVLVLLACEAVGGDPVRAMPAACAVEMVHTYSLIHDDLPAMDDDDFRRGRPTNHKVFGEALAILAGDGLLTRAFEVVAREIHPGDVAAACVAELARASGMIGMVAGQVADLEAEHQPDLTISQLEAIHRRKTGCLLTSSLVMGGLCGGASARETEALSTYGQCLGLAFQITDDLLDIRGDVGIMGKAVQKDAAHGKLTYPKLLGEAGSEAEARRLIEQATSALTIFGDRRQRLEALAQFVLERDH
jgi:geranylgeranyl diphosphate synthase, type II